MDQEITTVLGKGSAFDGKLTFEGAVRIDGDFSGEIQTDGTLIVGEPAQVTAEIRAANVIIEGSVRGDVVASTSLEIHQTARVHGNLSTPSLEIQKGALFEGNCRMTADPAPAHASNGKSRRSDASSDIATDSVQV